MANVEKSEQLGSLWDIGMESSPVGDGEEVFARLRTRLEQWLRTEVGTSYDKMKADPSRARSVAQVRGSLAAEHERAKKDRR